MGAETSGFVPDTDKQEQHKSQENLGKFVAKHGVAALGHACKMFGADMLGKAGLNPAIPEEMRGWMAAGGVGLMGAGEVLKMWQSGELKTLTETVKTEGVKEAAKAFFKNRVNNPFYLASTLADVLLVTSAMTNLPQAEMSTIAMRVGKGLFVDGYANVVINFRESWHMVGALGHGGAATLLPGIHLAAENINQFFDTNVNWVKNTGKGIWEGIKHIGEKSAPAPQP